MLEVRNLTLGYGRPLLKDISFSAEPGEIIGILGRNGCGKTTLLRGISGSVKRFAGEILVDGKDYSAMKARQQARLISMLPQQTRVMEGIAVYQLLAMGRYPHSGFFQTITPAEKTLIYHNAERLGIECLLDHDCTRLSQGQLQLVLLCRLLVQDTPVMLLDEPNTALDYDNTFAMFRILRDVVRQQKKIVLTVLHDPELALANCHRLLMVKDGGICRAVNPAQDGLSSTEEALREIYPNLMLREDPVDGRFRCYGR